MTYLGLTFANLCLVLVSYPCHADEFGGSITNTFTIPKTGSPHTITRDLIVEPVSKLIIEPGSQLRFAQGVGIKVYGQLEAVGKPSDRILFTKSSGGSVADAPPSWPADIRLANGSDILEGVVQVLYKGRWRSICANYANWTASDAEVVCRQLGFASPLNDYFTYNFTATEYHDFMAITQPKCSGKERGLLDCPGADNPKYSSQICRDQRTLYIKCQGLREDMASNHWSGIQFYNTSFERRLLGGGDALNESTSILEHVDILYAGVTNENLPTAAISASPYVPTFNNVRVKFSAYDAFNFTDVNSTTNIRDCEVSYNRGHGLNVTTSFGRVRISSSSFTNNWGNGLYVRTVDKIYRRWEWRTGDLCSDPPSSSFPQLYTVMAPSGSNACKKRFVAAPGKFVTISLLEMYKDPLVKSAKLYLYNGDCYVSNDCGSFRSPLLNTWDIQDLGTIGLPQAEVTTQSVVTIEFKLDKTYNRHDLCYRVSGCVRLVLFLSSAEGPAEDVILDKVSATDNLLHGALVENPRSYIKVTNSVFSRNKYGAGFRIRGGASDLYMADTEMIENANTGLNITYAGGRRIFQNVISRRNAGIGMYIDYVHEFKDRIERHQKTELIGVKIEDNNGIGLRVGNYCSDSLLAINTTNSAISRNKAQGIHVLSCYGAATGNMNFTIADTTFTSNGYQAVLVSPMLSMIGMIRNSTFTSHKKGVILIDNTDDLQRNRAFLDKTVGYAIESNWFTGNTGRYVVNMRLTETSVQRLLFRYNRVRDNMISMAGTILKPRSRARGVVVVSSSNVYVNRNLLINPDSSLEVATHCIDTLITIDATMNWWGSDMGPGDTVSTETHLDAYHKRIANKIMDQESRYNLASVQYYPALKTAILSSSQDSSAGAIYIREFLRTDENGTLYLGGVLREGSHFETDRNTEYIVDSDINVHRNTEFKISPGTVLHFDNTVGVLVHGKIYAVGSASEPIILKRREEDNPYSNMSWIRLTGGKDEMEGVLEVNVTGEWSTVCNKGWTMREASVVCQHFGYTLQPETWFMTRPEITDPDQPIIMNYVKCTDSDSDIRDCLHDLDTEFNDCTHADDVTLRCVPPTWAGIQITTAASKSELRHVTIEEAGLLDYFTNKFVPALQLDKNQHIISDLRIKNSSATGLLISYSEPFGENTPDISRINVISRSHFINNLGDGLKTLSSYLTMEDCTFSNNGQSGFSYDPKLPLKVAFNIRKSIPVDMITDINRAVNNTIIKIPAMGATKYIQAIDTGNIDNETIIFEVKAAAPDQKVTLQLFDYSPETHVESLVIYDSKRESITVAQKTTIDTDSVDFPLVSSGDTLTLQYTVNGVKSGRLLMIISSRADSDVPDRGIALPNNVRATIRLTNCTFSDNKRGLLLTHYNNPSNEYMDLFVRNKYEQVILDRVLVTGSTEEAMLVPSVTKYNEVYMPDVQELLTPQRMSNITYIITDSTFSQNGAGIMAEHNHVEYSNNMMRWRYRGNHMKGNKQGGLYIELPLILNPYRNGNHSIEINDSRFTGNDKFQFVITGGFANLTMARNVFSGNQARKGLITLSGTEKKMDVSDNEIVDNRGRFMFETYMTSHSEFGVTQSAELYRNKFKDNRPLNTDYTTTDLSKGASYSIAIRGVQKLNVTRNLFQDEMTYALVADVPSTSLQTTLNVTKNYWSTTNQSVIRQKIFDFNDWSSYALAEYWPYLTSADFDATVTGDKMEEFDFDLSRPLGGVINKDTTIPHRATPYQVVSDITVEQGVTLTIDPGVVFEIKPNVGFLILGRLLANGLTKQQIKFLPAKNPVNSNEVKVLRYKRAMEVSSDSLLYNLTSQSEGTCRSTSQDNIRLCGGEHEKEGFIQMYNTTINAWSLLCDPQFNDYTAEVFCRTLGYYSGNPVVRFSELYEYFTFGRDRNMYKDLWTRTFLCRGDEDSIEQCGERLNYNLERCSLRRGYVFLRCGERNLEDKYEYWGNIRFATNTVEAGRDDIPRSALRNVVIQGAGILHGYKVPAILSTYQSPSTYNLEVKDCAEGGLNFISPRSEIFLLNSKIENNQGVGVNLLVLNGEKGWAESKFKPLNTSSIPYRVFGMVDICSADKVITVSSRVLIYYKYDFLQVDCVKVIRSALETQQLSIRFLQVNLFHDNFSRNAVEVFDGPEFVDGMILANITEPTSKLYRTTMYKNIRSGKDEPQYQMGIHIHASPASGMHGFIAEVTTGDSYTGADGVHRVIGNYFSKNSEGSLRYSTVGEKNPGVVIAGNTFKQNGMAVLNLTSAENVLLEVQNVPVFSMSNNMFWENNGSCTVWLRADVDASRVLRGNISNNVFYGTQHGEALRVYGNSYQELLVLFNYFTKNLVDNLNTVDIRKVITNVTGNIMYWNQGAHCLDLWSDEEITTSQQIVYRNFFYDNFAGDKFKDAQIGGNNTLIYAAGLYRNKKISYNWLENRFNFELTAHNRTSYAEKPWENPNLAIDAEKNYWGHKIGVDNNNFTIAARIHDYRDDTNLSMVNFYPYFPDNITLLSGTYEEGYCLPGWVISESKKCYRYYGGIATYYEAQELCSHENATIARPDNRFWVEIGKVIQYAQQDYSQAIRAWVDEAESSRKYEVCSVIIDSRYDEADCLDRLPFVCQNEQIGAIPAADLLYLWVIIGVCSFLLLAGLIFLAFFFCKARARKEQRFERRASLRSSIRSNKYAISNGALTHASQTNLATTTYGSSRGLSIQPQSRARSYTRETSRSIALTDYNVGETDVDHMDDDDNITIATRKTGYASTGSLPAKKPDTSDSESGGERTPLTKSQVSIHVPPKGYAASVDSNSRHGSRDDLSRVSAPVRSYRPLHEDAVSEAPYQYDPTLTETVEPSVFQNDGYTTDQSAKYAVPVTEPYQPATASPSIPSDHLSREEHAYVNTSALHRRPDKDAPIAPYRPAQEPEVDIADLKRKEMYNQRRPTRPPPQVAAAALQPYAPRSTGSQPESKPSYYPPGYNTAVRGDAAPPQPAARPRDYQYYGEPQSARGHDLKRDSFSTLDTKSIDSLESDWSTVKPPPSYFTDKKPYDTDGGSMYSVDAPDSAYQYQPQTRYYPRNPQPRSRDPYLAPSPLVTAPRYQPSAATPNYDTESVTSSQAYNDQNYLNDEQELSSQGFTPGNYNQFRGFPRRPAAETDIDAMSEMTDDSWHPRGRPTETDF